jgi:hypothetical protein
MKIIEYTAAQELASLCQAIHNCRESGNDEWAERHADQINWIRWQFLPSGSGVDCGTHIDLEKSNGKKLVLLCQYHHMNDTGMYDGWTGHTITVTPAFRGVDISIGGPDRNNIKDYLYDIFDEALAEICHCIWYEGQTQHNEMGWYYREQKPNGEWEMVWHNKEMKQ